MLYKFEENIDVTSEDIQPSHGNVDNFDPEPPHPLLSQTPVQSTIHNSVNAHLCPKKKVQITPLLMYQIHLQYTLNQVHNMTLSLQDKINEIIVSHSKKGLDLSNVKCYSKKRLIQTVATIYNLHHLKPQIIQVPLANPALFASVAVFDLKAQIIHLLHNYAATPRSRCDLDWHIDLHHTRELAVMGWVIRL